MLRNDRNLLINFNLINGSITVEESQIMYRISSLIDDDEDIDIDWEELQEVCDIVDIQKIEQILDLMYDLDILSELSYEGGYYG